MRNIWTTLIGAAVVATAAFIAYQKGEFDAQTGALLLVGMGLLKARDGKVIDKERD